MQYRKFGNTGVMISRLGFGAMRLPQKSAGGKMVTDHEEGVRIIQRAFELGVNYIDSAPYYCDSESEVVVGKALKGWREKVYVSTKHPVGDGSFRDLLEGSLKKLDTGWIDFYHFWGIDWETYENKILQGGLLDQAFQAKAEGLIRHLSFSFHDKPENLMRLADTGNFESVLCQYNMLDRGNEEAIAYASAKGMGVVVMGPVGGGRLGMPSEVIQKLIPGGPKSSAELALRFVFANPNISCALSGMGSLAMVTENAATATRDSALTPAEVTQLNAAMEQNQKLADLYCTGCKYCMPCPNEVNIPLNFQLMNYHRVYGLTEYAREEYKKIGTLEWMPGKPADECIECGDCETKCPQNLSIRDQLRETAAALG